MSLQYQSLQSAVDIEFWHYLNKLKLNEWKLDESIKHIKAGYSNPKLTYITNSKSDKNKVVLQARLSLESKDESYQLNNVVYIDGELRNYNTKLDFKEAQHNHILRELAAKIWKCIQNDDAISQPSLLNQFLLLSFADLKYHQYHYWFAFPALIPKLDNNEKFAVIKEPMQKLSNILTSQQYIKLLSNFSEKYCNAKLLSAAFFIIYNNDDNCYIEDFKNYDQVLNNKQSNQHISVGFIDTCNLSNHPGWTIRNLLLLISVKFRISNIKIICFRDMDIALGLQSRFANINDININDDTMSTIVDIELTKLYEKDMNDIDEYGIPNWLASVGWERNNKNNKLQPKKIDLKTLMNPKNLAATAVDLNLKLMRWRVLPSLDLPKISNTKCLLLGAGTLGCSVARTLIGWGVRNITFVDNGTVSFSNPVRQSLYVFNDCLNSGRDKAECAAEHLIEIFPDMNAKGYKINIPMPGHNVKSNSKQEETTINDIKKLDELVQENDVIFLLTDSRESRWLPTVLCSVYDKLCINLALGFDTFVVMRHGHRAKYLSNNQINDNNNINNNNSNSNSDNNNNTSSDNNNETLLGCYFCNDVVAPTDSLTRRTLDQQCTVTRPGLSFLASSLGVELMISILHHPLQHKAPALKPNNNNNNENHNNNDNETQCPLGDLPHQLRGFLRHFQIVPVVGQQFSKCTACSEVIINAYKTDNINFVLKVLNGPPSVLEDMSGLTDLKRQTEEMDDWDIDISDDDEGLAI